MRTLQLSLAIGCALTLAGCLDTHSGPQDQWMNTDAYVAPPDAAVDDGGTAFTCDDAGPVFASPTQVSTDPGADAGAPTAVQSDVALTSLTGGHRVLAWVDRSLAATGSASLRVNRITPAALPGSTITVTQPAACAALVQPSLTVAGDGTVVLAAVCLGSSELAPSASDIVVFRSTDDGVTFGAGTTVVSCPATTTQCSHPSLAASAAAVNLAYASEALNPPAVTGGQVVLLRSDDNGATFPTVTPIPDSGNIDVASPALAYSTTDVLHIAYTGYPTLGGSGYVTYVGLPSPADPPSAPQNLGPGHDADVVATADGVLIVFAAAGYAEETHAGADGSFTPPLPINTSLGATALIPPRVALGADGTLHVFWLAEVGGEWQAVYSRSTDGAATFLAPLTVAGPFDGDPTAVRFDHRLGPVGITADTAGVVTAWGDPGTTDPSQGVTNISLATLVCN